MLLSNVTNSSGAVMTTIAGGLPGEGVVLSLGGSVDTATQTSFSGSTPNTFLGQMQIFPSAVTLSSMSAKFVLGVAQVLVGTTVTLTAQLYKVPNGSTSATAVSGFNCQLSPSLTGVVAVDTLASCTASGLNASFSAGDSAFIVVYGNAAGISLLNTISGSLSVGVGQ
jgi:hypothetical protein